MIEKRVPINKDILVRSAESSIIAQATTLGTAGGSSGADSGGSGGNNEGDDKAKNEEA